MKKLLNIILKNLHFIVLLYSGYLNYQAFQNFETDLKLELSNIENIQRTIIKEKKKNTDAEKFSQNLESSKLKIKELKKQIEEVQKQLPNIISDTDVLDLFSREASNLNIKDVILKPLGEEEKDFYFSKKYSLRGQGTFLQFLIFYEKIGAQDRIYNISELSIAKDDKSVSKGRFQILNFETVMEAFRYNPAKTQKIDSSLETSNKKRKKARGGKV